jgi:uncharacterized RDD family membrane protein YckC
MENPYAAPKAPTEVDVASARVGFWPRLGAALIDFAVVVAVGFLISDLVSSWFADYLAQSFARAQAKLDPKAAAAMTPALIQVTQTMARISLGAVLFGLPYALLEGLTGRALGKLLLGLRIADVDGKPAKRGRLLGRAALKDLHRILTLVAMLTGVELFAQIAQVPFWVMALGCFFVFAAHRRALHDLAAGTAVYRNSDVVAAAR